MSIHKRWRGTERVVVERASKASENANLLSRCCQKSKSDGDGTETRKNRMTESSPTVTLTISIFE